MASYLVKYVVDGVTKTVQGDRNNQSFNALKSAISRHSGKSSFSLTYTGSSGNFAVSDDASLKAALADAEKGRKPHVRLVLN